LGAVTTIRIDVQVDGDGFTNEGGLAIDRDLEAPLIGPVRMSVMGRSLIAFWG
jgi:hypothetical protein